MKTMKIPAALPLLMLLPAACGQSRPEGVGKADGLPPVFPDYTGVTVPVNISPLNFEVTDADEIWVEVKSPGRDEILLSSGGRYADFPLEKWHSILEMAAGDSLEFTVYAEKNGRWVQYEPFFIKIADDVLPDWGLTYRRVAPGYETYGKMGIYQRNLSSFEERAILENTLVPKSCVNCHTSNRTNPGQLTYHLRGSRGGTFVRSDADAATGEWYCGTDENVLKGAVYPYWHPSGKYCAFSINSTSQGFINDSGHPVEVYDSKSDVVVFDIAGRKLITSPLLQSENWNENTPSFSPDGKWLYFTTSPLPADTSDYKDVRYNICRIGFDMGNGRFGETVDTLFNASEHGKSATWPRPSYDGKYLLFTLADYGYFSIWHPEARQYILNLSTGRYRAISESEALSSGSYHNWSSDSRWIVFTSRRKEAGTESDDMRYTRLYLAHVDADGNVGKPFLLPQKDPATYYGETLYSFNTPDFTHVEVDYDVRQSLGL